MNAFALRWMEMSAEERSELTPEEIHYFTDPDFLSFLRVKIKEMDLKKYRYLITFTLDPKRNRDKTKEYLEEACEQYVTNQAWRDPLHIIYYAFVKEYTKSGQPHWHAVVITTKPLKKDRFNHYIKLYGNIDISKTKVTNIQESLNYISKEGIPVIVKE